jgi:P-type Ca2+ transporter type 2C
MDNNATMLTREMPDETGLTGQEAALRLRENGPNVIAPAEKISVLRIAIAEITEPMILLLPGVGVLYSLWGGIEDAATIFVIITLPVAAEVWNEVRAKKAIHALSQLAVPKTNVIRDGKAEMVDSTQIVPDDLLILTPGTQVAADARVTSSYGLQANESALTGESMPVAKEPGDVLYAGTMVTSGEGKARVTTTGKRTRMGQISAAAKAITQPKTPLQRYMKSLAFKLIFMALFFSVPIPLLGILRRWNFQQMVPTSLSLVFATIPRSCR